MLELRGRGCSELRLCLCTPVWVTTVRLCLKKKKEEKSKPIGTLYPEPSHKQGHTKTQNKGLVEDLSIKWRAKKKKKKEL